MRKWRQGFGVIVFICVITTFWSIAYWLTNLFFPTIDELTNDYVKQLVSVLLGTVIMAMFGFIMGRLFGHRRTDLFRTTIDAIRQIAKGNFKVKLAIPKEQHNPFTRLAESINHMAEELNQLEKMRQTFISNVSHEIQSPLTSIRSFARALQNEQLTPKERSRYLGIIETESTRLSRLSDNLLKLTSLESEHHPVALKEYRLDKQLKQIILANEPQWLAKKITINLDLAEVSITADEELLNQVWTNLLHNSIKFTPTDGEINICMQQTEQQITIMIADTGIGISEEDQIHIFDRFYKADNARNRSLGGSGLGLSIVNKIVEMHQGTIKVNSILGKGTKLCVTLPQNCAYSPE